MYHREKRKMNIIIFSCLLTTALCKSIDGTVPTVDPIGDVENNIIDFEEDYSIKLNKKYGAIPWESNERYNKEMHRYTVVKDKKIDVVNVDLENNTEVTKIVEETTPENDYSVIPLELLSTTQDYLASIVDSTTEQDLTVIPLSTTKKVPKVVIQQSVTLPTSTENADTTTEFELSDKLTEDSDNSETTTIKRETTSSKNDEMTTQFTTEIVNNVNTLKTVSEKSSKANTTALKSPTNNPNKQTKTNDNRAQPKIDDSTETKFKETLKTNSSKLVETIDSTESGENDSNISELDFEEIDVPEDYYDSKDVVPTTAPKTDALSVIFGLAGSVVESVVESVAERVVPKSIFDLFKRMQKQNEALEAERLRSREENGGLGQFGRGILKSISSGLSKPLSQIMQGVKDIGSLDTDRGFVSSVASGVTSVANVATSVADAFKDRVQAIYPGTVWCGDGHSATARSSDLGLFFFTDTCCREHDACKIYIKAGETKYGLTNTGLFTRSHCSCDIKFRECLRKTNSLVSAQIGLTYFNVLGPQCFRKAHPIVKCMKRTRITGQKCEEYELDYTKPKMWQWFDNETF